MELTTKNNSEGVRLGGTFYVNHYNSEGELVDSFAAKNIVTNEGVTYALDVALSNGSQSTTWYIGLKGTGAVAAGHTSAQIGGTNGWSEVTTYTEGVRQTWTDAGVSAKSLTNAASPASFSINGTVTVFGAFLISNSTKSGTTGTLFAAADFSSSKALNNGDTLEVTYAISGDDDGV